MIKRIGNKEINFYCSAHAMLMILLASVESIPYGVLSSHTSIATMWLEQVITYVIHSHHFSIQGEVERAEEIGRLDPTL